MDFDLENINYIFISLFFHKARACVPGSHLIFTKTLKSRLGYMSVNGTGHSGNIMSELDIESTWRPKHLFVIIAGLSCRSQFDMIMHCPNLTLTYNSTHPTGRVAT
uniref:Uncharacterized protein n=1 Tax=Sphaerodactylus townsendi TaxID=933632 RepID=A0ACB8FPL2_9SAUR